MAARRLTQYFWATLPGYFHDNDTYKTADPAMLDRGILERYLDVMQTEGEILEDYITQMPDQIFPLTTDEKFLSYIAALYGYPPDTFGDEDWYRALLRNIIKINQVKGTAEGFNRFFAIMSTEVEISTSLTAYSRYDDGTQYDDGSQYDGYCDPCVIFNINIVSGSPIPGISGTYSEAMKRSIQSILRYLLPINAKIGTFSYAGVPKTIEFATDETNLVKFLAT